MILGAFTIAMVFLLWSVPAFGGGSGHRHGTPAHDGAMARPTQEKAGGHGGHEQRKGHAKQRRHEPGHHATHGTNGHADRSSSGDPLEARGRQLVVQLHCNACHLVSTEITHEHHGDHKAVAPDLSFEGDKVNPGWLFEFLKRPHRIRSSIGGRMPNFGLSDREALALTEHIKSDLRSRTLPPLPGRYRVHASDKELTAGIRLVSQDYLDCFKCHPAGDRKPEGDPTEWGPDLLLAKDRLRPEWIIRWLMDPQQIEPGTKMPTYFSDGDSGPDDILEGDEERQILALQAYLLNHGPEVRSSRYAEAKKRFSDVTTGDGWALMQKLNCAGCHDVGRMHERDEVAPPLAHEGSRVRHEWLVDFLLNPTRIRPVGYVVGSPARMPDFRLSRAEAEAITAFLMSQRMPDMPRWWKGPPPPAVAAKGRALYQTWNCVSCHRGSGSTAPTAVKFEGPNLSRVGQRLKPDHLLFWLKGGSGTVDTHPVAPTLGLTDDQLKALVAYLATLR